MSVNFDPAAVPDDFFNANEGLPVDRNQGFYPCISMDLKSPGKRLSWLAYPKWTVLEFKLKIVDMELGAKVKQEKAPELTLVYSAKTLENPRTLESYGINSEMQAMFLAVTLNGGPQAVVKRRMDPKQPLLKGRGSRQPDCINGEDKEWRASLTCGCVICAETAFNWICHSFSSNPFLTDLTCPNPKCGKSVAWPLLAAIAGLTQGEFNKYTIMLRRRQEGAMRRHFTSCPFCKTSVTRPKALNMIRVRCPLCSKADFCFCCSQIWKGGGVQLCGNDSCTTAQLQKMLNDCETTDYFKKAKPCPKMRACPQCLQLVIYRQACSHIICPNKECPGPSANGQPGPYEFCLVCLRKYPCDSSTCQVADRQKLN